MASRRPSHSPSSICSWMDGKPSGNRPKDVWAKGYMVVILVNEEVGRAVPKREALLRNGFRGETGLPVTDTGHRDWL